MWNLEMVKQLAEAYRENPLRGQGVIEEKAEELFGVDKEAHYYRGAISALFATIATESLTEDGMAAFTQLTGYLCDRYLALASPRKAKSSKA